MKRVCNLCHSPKDESEFINAITDRCVKCQIWLDEQKFNKKDYVKNRRKTDFLFNLRMSISSRTTSAISSKNWHRGGNNEIMLGANRETVIKHIESKFKDGMSWENRPLWHIDHIVPLSSAKTEEQLYNLANYQNLSPEWKADNLRKSSKIPHKVLRIGKEEDEASNLVSWYFFNLDCKLDIAKECATRTIDFMLTHSFADINYWEKVKGIINSDELILKP